ncbi:MAG: ribosomal-processing cysteine protease Prp [Tissierellia bacterium]|nr:ribosomal-processing cysteine protease Prp [Tissierellia bacterium]
MIKVTLKTREKKLLGFQVTGHAGYDDYGKDIVCAAVSVLTFNAINSLEEIIKLKKEIKYTIKDNFIELDIYPEKFHEQNMHDTQLILRSFEMGVISILREYQEMIGLYYKEV